MTKADVENLFDESIKDVEKARAALGYCGGFILTNQGRTKGFVFCKNSRGKIELMDYSRWLDNMQGWINENLE